MIDRIGITIGIDSEDKYKMVYSQLYSMTDEQKHFVPNGKIIVRKGKYTTRLDYYPAYGKSKSERRKIADITIGANKIEGMLGLYRHLTLTLYPQNFRDEEFLRFQEMLSLLLPDYDYAKLFELGKVNYLELAVDNYSHKCHSFLPYRKGCVNSEIFKESTGHLGTTYLGSKKSDIRFRIYDKNKCLIDKGHEPATKSFPNTRIEVALRRTGLRPKELLALDNPFTKLRIADLDQLLALSAALDWQQFLDDARTNGVPYALSKQPNKRRKFRGMIDSVQVGWWSPESIWKDLPKALAKIAPQPSMF